MTDLVRQATARDESALYALLIDLHRENRFGWGTPYDPATVLARIEVGTRPVRQLPNGTFQSARTNPLDNRAGWIGVIGPEAGPLVGTVGLFIEPAAWFAREAVALFELWLYVRPGQRDHARLERELFAFADHTHEAMKAKLADTGYPFPFPLQTGYMHRGPRFGAMARLWRRMSRAEPVGMLFLKP